MLSYPLYTVPVLPTVPGVAVPAVHLVLAVHDVPAVWLVGAVKGVQAGPRPTMDSAGHIAGQSHTVKQITTRTLKIEKMLKHYLV